jgi:hypothetical protein
MLRALLVLLAIGVTVALGLATSNWQELLRRVIVLQLRDTLHRQVYVGGIQVSLLGRIRISDVRIAGNAGEHTPFVSARTIEVVLDPLSLTAFPRRPLSAIRQISLDHPIVTATRNTAGRWNFDDILQTKSSASQDQFHGEVVVREGEVFYRDAHGWDGGKGVGVVEHLTHLSLRVARGSNGFIPFRLSATSANGHVRTINANGEARLSEGHAECQVRIGAVDVGFVEKYLKSSLPFTLISGTADGRWQIVMKKDRTGDWHSVMSLLADVHHIHGLLRYSGKQVPCDIATGQVRLATDVVELVEMRALVGGVPVVTNGMISNFDTPVLALQIQVDHGDAAAVSRLIPGLAKPDYHWFGQMTGWAQLTGRSNDIRVIGHVQGPSVQATLGHTPAFFQDLAADLQYQGQSLALSRVAGRVFGGSFVGQAWATIPTGAGTTTMIVQGQAQHLQVAEVARFIAAGAKDKSTVIPVSRFSGDLSGPVSMTVSADDTFSLMAQAGGAVRIQGVLAGHVDTSVRVDIGEGQAARTEIERLDLRTAEGHYHLRGTLLDDQLHVAVQGSGIDLRAVGQRFQRQLSGQGYLIGTISGVLARPAFTGQVRARDGYVETHHFAELAADIQAAMSPTPRVSLHNVRLLSGNRQLEVTATEITASLVGKDPASAQWRIRQINLSRSRLASLLALSGINLPLDGFAEGSIAYADYPAGAQGKGRLLLSRPSYRFADATLELDSAQIDFTLLDARTIHIDQAVLTYEGAPGQRSVIYINGRISTDPRLAPAAQLSLHIEGKDLPVDNFTVATGDIKSVGSFAADGRLRLPVDLGGTIDMSADISGQLVDPVGKLSSSAILAQSLVIKGALDGGNDFAIARVPYPHFSGALEFHLHDQTLQVGHFVLAPQDGRDYQVSLKAPGKLQFASPAFVEMQLSLTSARDLSQPADLAAVRHDMMTMAGHASAWGKMLQAHLIAGKALCTLALEESLQRPIIGAELSVQQLTVDGDVMPSLAATVHYDMPSRTIKIDQLTANGGINADAELSVDGSIGPLESTPGNMASGPLNLHVEAQNINPGLLSRWFPASGLAGLGGTINLEAYTINNATTDKPEMRASVDWFHPVIHGVAFGPLNAILSLESDAGNSTVQRLWIGQRQLGEGGAATLQLRDARTVEDPPLSVYGYLPIRWTAPWHPTIVLDAPFALTVNIPQQKLESAKAYLPLLPAGAAFQGDGTLAGRLQLGGTLNAPEFGAGSFLLAKAAELVLPPDKDGLPDRFQNMSVDLGFRAEERNGHRENVIDVNDISSNFDNVKLATKQPSPWERILATFTKKAPQATPRVDAWGTIRMLTPENGWQHTDGLQKQLRYDLYARSLNTPLHVDDTCQGTVTACLHLGNRADNARPLLTGILYAQNCTINYTGGSSTPFVLPRLPINPELSVCVQLGPKNQFFVKPNNNILGGFVFAAFPLIPTGTKLFSPAAIIDSAHAEALRNGMPNRDELPLYTLTADAFYTLTAKASPVISTASVTTDDERPVDNVDTVGQGSYGRITGTLAQPTMALNYVVLSRRAQIQLPGGILNIESAQGAFKWSMGATTPPSLSVQGQASATLDKHTIAVTMDGGDLLRSDNLSKMLTMQDTSPPVGEQALTQDEILAQLIGVSDLASLVDPKTAKTQVNLQDMVRIYGYNKLFGWSLFSLTQGLDLQTLAVSYDHEGDMNTSFTTQEFGETKWSAFRYGASRVFADTPTWNMWIDYRLPRYPWLRNLTVTGTIDNLQESTIGLKYTLSFVTAKKQ